MLNPALAMLALSVVVLAPSAPTSSATATTMYRRIRRRAAGSDIGNSGRSDSDRGNSDTPQS
jgi:type IV pilus biogenesis protein CpaD/CtpE